MFKKFYSLINLDQLQTVHQITIKAFETENKIESYGR